MKNLLKERKIKGRILSKKIKKSLFAGYDLQKNSFLSQRFLQSYRKQTFLKKINFLSTVDTIFHQRQYLF
jgi:hypothetical protein